jgi:choice-of-anchor B domain-containing protein
MIRTVRVPLCCALAAILVLPAFAQKSATSAADFKTEAAAAEVAARAKSASGAMPAVTGGAVPCEGGDAAGYACDGVDLLSFLPLASVGAVAGQELADIWGWTDPETGKEWALVARTDGTSFVDVSDPENPRYVGQILTQPGTRPDGWRDVKVYQNHAYIVADGTAGDGVQVFDLTRLRTAGDIVRTFSADAVYTGVEEVHNIVINEDTGFAYAVGSNAGNGNECGAGLHMIDIRTPGTPVFAGCFLDNLTGIGNRGYIHDAQCVVYDGPDEEYLGREICVNSSELNIGIADVTDKNAPVAVSRASYPDARYVHQGWLTEDHRYFVQNDELDELRQVTGPGTPTRTFVWDLEDLDDPVLLATYESDLASIDHNLYVKGDLVYQANYTSGLRMLDLSDPSAPEEVAFFDTTPSRDGTNIFDGLWSVYPYFESGIVIASSIGQGLFVFRLDEALMATSSDTAREVPEALRIASIYPNPARGAATLTLGMHEAGAVEVVLYDAAGRAVGTVFAGTLGEGEHTLPVDTEALPAGTYLVRASTAQGQVSRTITVVR